MTPLTIGLLFSTGWVLAAPVLGRPLAWVVMAATVVLRSRPGSRRCG